MSEDTPQRGPTGLDILKALRPNQWTKNALVLAAFFFALGDRTQSVDIATGLWVAVSAFVLFCLTSSGVYLVNDILDREADRQHPVKKYRPIASGRVPVRTAWSAAAVLIAGSCVVSWLLCPAFGMAVTAYALLQTAYSMRLKRVAMADILAIAAGFVLRAIAGAVAVGVVISPWLLLCTFLLALFLALCKRRHEKLLAEETSHGHRPSLAGYDTRVLDQLIAIVSASTVVCYAIYTLSPETVQKFGTSKLGFTIPLVMFGIFRYLDLAYRHNRGDRPEKILLTDVPILVNLALYTLTVVVIFLAARLPGCGAQ